VESALQTALEGDPLTQKPSLARFKEALAIAESAGYI